MSTTSQRKLRNWHKHYLVFQSLNLSPPAHDKRIVGSDDSNFINALRLEFVILLQEAWQVVDVTRRLKGSRKIMILLYTGDIRGNTHCESSGYRDEYNLLPAPGVCRQRRRLSSIKECLI